MGLGKTPQAVVASDQINAQRILVLCPASVRINWTREYAKFSTRPVTTCAVLTSSDGIRCLQETANGGLVACSYDLAVQPGLNALLRQWLLSAPGSLLIPDESHFLKSVDAQRSHAVLARGGLAHAAARTWALSGTPAPNNLAELYPLLRTFGTWRNSFDAFKAKFCDVKSTPYGDKIVGHKNIPEFRQLMAPVMLRRKKDEVMKDLPKIVWSEVTVQPGPVDYELEWPDYWIVNRIPRLHEQIMQQREAAEKIIQVTAFHQNSMTPEALSAQGYQMLAGLSDSVAHMRKEAGLKKVQPVVDLVKDEFASGLDKIVLFGHHKGVVEGLREGLKEFGAVSVYGGTPPLSRQKKVDKFNRDPRCKVFIGNIQAAGTGLNLTVANQLMFVEQDWVPGNNAQAAMRVHRIGQTRKVTVRVVLLDDDPIDARIQMALRRKMRDLVLAFD